MRPGDQRHDQGEHQAREAEPASDAASPAAPVLLGVVLIVVGGQDRQLVLLGVGLRVELLEAAGREDRRTAEPGRRARVTPRVAVRVGLPPG